MDIDYKELNDQRNAALEEFRNFIKTLPKKGFTVKQLEMIGNNAKDEVQHVIADIERRLILSEDMIGDPDRQGKIYVSSGEIARVVREGMRDSAEE